MQDESWNTRILKEINLLRQSPDHYVKILQNQLKYMQGNILQLPGSEYPMELEEGARVYNEAIEFLKKQKPLKPLLHNSSLQKACQDHIQDILNQQSHSALSHTGSDKSSYKDRIERYCRWGGSIFEALDFAPRTEPADIVVTWLVDDGNPKRSHRIQLFNDKLKHAATLSGLHPHFQITCSIALFAAQVEPLADKNSEIEAETKIQTGSKRLEKIQSLNFSQFSLQVFTLINKVRSNPQQFQKYLEKSMDRFEIGTNILKSADGQQRIQTSEGAIAFIEAIEFLRVQKALPPFKWSDPLSNAARDHTLDLSKTGLTSVTGSDGSLPTDRISRYCKIDETWAESLVFGCCSPEEVVQSLIVNDGQPSIRGYRTTLFNKNDLKLLGIQGATHPSEDSVVSLVYAKGILVKGQDQKINVTVTDKVSNQLIETVKSMGIDASRIKVIKDSDVEITEQRANKIFKNTTVAPQQQQREFMADLVQPKKAITREKFSEDQTFNKNRLLSPKTNFQAKTDATPTKMISVQRKQSNKKEQTPIKTTINLTVQNDKRTSTISSEQPQEQTTVFTYNRILSPNQQRKTQISQPRSIQSAAIKRKTSQAQVVKQRDLLSPSNSTTKHAFFSGFRTDTSLTAKVNTTTVKAESEKQKTSLFKNKLIASTASKKSYLHVDNNPKDNYMTLGGNNSVPNTALAEQKSARDSLLVQKGYMSMTKTTAIKFQKINIQESKSATLKPESITRTTSQTVLSQKEPKESAGNLAAQRKFAFKSNKESTSKFGSQQKLQKTTNVNCSSVQCQNLSSGPQQELTISDKIIQQLLVQEQQGLDELPIEEPSFNLPSPQQKVDILDEFPEPQVPPIQESIEEFKSDQVEQAKQDSGSKVQSALGKKVRKTRSERISEAKAMQRLLSPTQTNEDEKVDIKEEPHQQSEQAERISVDKGAFVFDVEVDPDYPPTAINSHIVVEEIEVNGKKQRIIRKSYQLVDGTIKSVTKIEQI